MDLVASVDLDDDFRWCGGPYPEPSLAHRSAACDTRAWRVHDGI